MTEIERLKKALYVAMDDMRTRGRHDNAVSCEMATEAALRRINSILHPEPEYEDVPVERWYCLHDGSIYREQDLYLIEDNQCGVCGVELVKLTGIIKRAKPAPVERSVSVEAEVSGGQLSGAVYSGKIFQDWPFKTHPECHGKRGVLTFTWTDHE